MAPQKSVAEVPRSILPRLTWNGSSTRTTFSASHSAPIPAGRKYKQRTQGWSAITWQPQSPSFAHPSAAFSTAAREIGTSTSIARRFPRTTFYATNSQTVQSNGNPIRYNGVYVAIFHPARRAFHASAPRERDHHFDTLKFVQRLKDEGFSEEQAVATMRVLNDVIQESIQNLTRTMVLREDTERSAYTQKVDFAKLRSELLNADSTEAQLTRSSHEKIAADLAKLNSRLRDEIGRTQASVRLDLNLEKGRIREEANSQEMRIKETETRIEQEVAGLRERVEAVKFSTLQWLMGVCTGTAALILGAWRLLIALITIMLFISWSLIWLCWHLVSPSSALLEVFQVYRPVLVQEDSNSLCDEQILLLDHVYGFSYGQPFVGYYEPPNCDFDTVRMNLTVTSRGRQFDRLAHMYLGDIEVFRTSTAEPTKDGIIWSYIKDMSQYNVLWRKHQKIIFELGNLINDIYTGSFNVTVTAQFSYEKNVKTADIVLPISAQNSARNSSSAFNVPSQEAKVYYKLDPRVSRAVVSISACGQSTEEFWWSNVFSSDTETFDGIAGDLYGYSPFREIQLYIDGILAGVDWPFPIIFTGGVSPGFWRPIVGTDAFDLRSPEIDISPFIPLLSDGFYHSFEIKIVGLNVLDDGTATLSNAIGSYWVVSGNIFLYLPESTETQPPYTTTHGQEPEVLAPAPTFTIARDLVKNQTGGNESLAYSVLAERTFTIRSSDFLWSQTLSFSNTGLFDQQGLSQRNQQHTSGRALSNRVGDGNELNVFSFNYPLLVNTTYGDINGGLTIDAWMRRRLEFDSTGMPGVSTYTLTSGPLYLHTEQWGQASYRSTADNKNSTSFGHTSDDFESHAGGRLYQRSVRAVNGSAVPDALAHAFTRHTEIESNRPPNKRRKLAPGAHSLRNLDDLPESHVPVGYIPLARFHLQLDFAHPAPSQDECSDSVDTKYIVPVLLKVTRPGPLELEEVPNHHVVLELKTIEERETIFIDTSTDPGLVKLSKHLNIASGLMCADRYHTTKLPTVCYQSSLRRLANRTAFRLETTILWKDSLEITDQKKLSDSALRAFSTYVLGKEEDDSPDIRRRNWVAAGGEGWTPGDFYNNVHVPLDTPSLSARFKCDMIECELFPFQRRAVRWLLEREGKELNPQGQAVPITDSSKVELPKSFQQITDADGETCFASHLHMIVTKNISAWYDVDNNLKGGILAEEMGLGKTVEMISLMCLNRRILRPEETFAGAGSESLRPTGATLIITPLVILEQWKQEIELHAPKLQVFHYTGIQRHQTLSDRELIELMADNDVVLTTYNVLAREIHYSGNAPKRNLRHEKRFEARKSPLVKISWWRVCLDEAQMIESGVSNAAKVARLIPRQMAWAVTGTPLRKDVTDLLGLLLFLQYEPFCGFIWKRLCTEFKPVMARIVNTLTLRHSKDLIRNELHLPPQKRIVITVPFTAVEEQHYRQLFEEMCDECGLDNSGSPRNGEWDPNDYRVIEKMRSWLVRLRQSCLYTTGNRRRGFATSNGPLRSVNEVLDAMIDQNDASIHAEERALLQSQLRRGQILENAKRKRESFDLWKVSLDRASELVQQCRERLQIERTKQPTPATNGEWDGRASVSDDEGEEAEKNPRLHIFRQRLRAALEVEHISVFFTGNAYYQIRSDSELTSPDSKEFQALAKMEEEAYARAKLIRQEMLTEISRKAKRYVKKIKEKSRKKEFVIIPKMKPQLYSKGLESRRVLDRLEEFCAMMNEHAAKYNEWRQKMIELLSQALIDQEDDSELEGDEYEKSTKHQDEMYVYMEALRALFADRHDALTGQKNVLIAHETKVAISQAQKGEGPSPTLYLEIMEKRSRLKPGPDLGSLRGVIAELRSLGTSFEWQANNGSSRARAELEILTMVLKNVIDISIEQTKIASNLEREVEMFRDTMNHRLEYYRQLQQISDTVAPYDEESAGKPLDHDLFNTKLKQEEAIDEKLSSLRAKGRYLIHLRDESGPDETSKICIICQNGFEIGVLTVCGHKYCKDCLRLWWHQHRTCPICKKRLKANDFYQITYKPQEFVVQEERSSPNEHGRQSNNSIYTDIGSGTLHEIKNIDLKDSFGTKIDTLARHILWLREHDPGAQSIVFSQYKSFLEYLGIAFRRLKIGYSSVDDPDGIPKFKSDPGIECFFLHAKAQSSGLNLINATHVFLCEPLINTAIELQAIARVHRIGQHRPTTVWMYLVSDTVEQSIYDISVSRRLDHIIEKVEKEKERKADSSTLVENGVNGAVIEPLSEVAIDSANSLEMQDAPLARLMASGGFEGELVRKDDLWQCLFGNPKQQLGQNGSLSAGGDVARFLRAEAAEQRRTSSINNDM
ncbi:peptide N-acetyl-beta-D-glucosaminyl asparaginase amidase A-domain-containing protein [Aspergillus cavernicola]|uniref:Peptide N-acetyl-beta-D-glucosaminyl asparaginase amidase A-domain-containing protein n=1 Tax=Aspergillus cavernicola TaxID=176166 RepID=A0ABR4ILJ3_9EURO